jgi:hypothetical protein
VYLFADPSEKTDLVGSNTDSNKKKARESLGFEIRCCPFLVFFDELFLDPGDGHGGPDARPEEGEDPADLE